MIWPYVSLSSIRTKDGYARRRKRWDEALGTRSNCKSLIRLATTITHHINSVDKESHVRHFAKVLLQHLYAASDRPINITHYFNNFSFDVIGEIAFGESFSLMEDAASAVNHRHIPHLLSQGVSMLRFLTPTPWITQLCFSMAPYSSLISSKWGKAIGWTEAVFDRKLGKDLNDEASQNDQQEDAFSSLIMSARRDGDHDSLSRLVLYGEAFLIVIAGSHTTAVTLTMLFYELSRRPSVQNQLREEIKSSTDNSGNNFEEDGMKGLEKIPLLNACINEALRLYPPVPTGGIRQTTDRGIMVGDNWIPPETMVVAPRWSIGRGEQSILFVYYFFLF